MKLYNPSGNIRRPRLELGAIIVAVLSSFPAIAQPSAETVETGTVEVVGTTPVHSLGVPVTQVPANVQTVKSEQIQERQSLGIAGYMSEALLGVNVNETQNNPYQPDVNFHGFTASPLLGTPQGLSVYQDGVRINEPFGDSVNWDLIPTVAISGINLMPGSNPLFGLNTLGGALSVQTKSGDTHPGGSVQAYAGSWGRHAVEGEYGNSLENGFNYYVAGNVFSEDGWRDVSDSDVRQFFAKAGWKGERNDFSISLATANNELRGNGYTPSSFLRTLDYDSVYTQPDITQNRLTFVTGQFNHYFTDHLAFNAVAYYRHNRASTFNADMNDDLGAALDIADLAGMCDGINGATPGTDGCMGIVNRTKTNQHGYGVTAQLSLSTENNLLIGGFGFDRARIDFNQSSQVFTEFNAGRGVGGVLDDVAEDVDLSGRTRTWSVFLTDTYNLTSKLALTASGRYNRTRVENHDHLVPLAGTGSLTGSQTFQRFNPAIGLTFNALPNLNLFGGYNEGSRAPSSIEIGCSDPAAPCNLPNSMAGDPPTLKQVVARTWEGGARGNFGNDLKWSAAAYRTGNDNDIQFIASNTSGAGYFDNVGKTRRVGMDVGVDGKVGAFKWMVGYSYVRATYESDFEVMAPANATASIDSNGDGTNDTIVVHKGDEIPGIPNHQLKFRGEFNVLPNWSLGGNLIAFSDQFTRGNENNSDPIGKIGGYTVVNLDTRYKFGATGWQLFAKVNNVFDREYATGGILGENMFDAAGAFSGNERIERFVAPGAPRAGWVGLRYEFGGSKINARIDND